MSTEQKSFKERIAKANDYAMVHLLNEYSMSKFDIGTWNKVKLRKALAGTGDYELAQRTLLCEKVHDIHSDRMSKRFLAKAHALKKILAVDVNAKESKIRSRCRFLTLVHSVEVLNVEHILSEIRNLKTNIENAIYQSKGIWCAGAIEVEVISLDLMKRVQAGNGVSELRKFEVCQILSKHLKKSERAHPSHFLLHFHGVVFASQEERFIEFEKLLKNYKFKNKCIWAKAPRQIQLKPISGQFAGKRKTLNANLKDIARYITKGGNDWFAGKAYLQYKLSFENSDVLSEDAWIQKNWKRNESLRKENIEDGLESVLSLTKSEIIYLAQTIDKMMQMSRNRQGYVVCASSSPSKAKLIISNGNAHPTLPI